MVNNLFLFELWPINQIMVPIVNFITVSQSCFSKNSTSIPSPRFPSKAFLEAEKIMRKAFPVHFPSFRMIFKTALVSIIFILELSVLHKSCLELKFQAKGIISRVPCTPVFLRSRTSGFQY